MRVSIWDEPRAKEKSKKNEENIFSFRGRGTKKYDYFLIDSFGGVTLKLSRSQFIFVLKKFEY